VDADTVEITTPIIGTAVVAFVGEHDLATREEAAGMLRDLLDTNDVIVVDLTRATFIDSSFLQLLLRADAQATESGKRFRVRAEPESVASRTLHLAGLSERFELATGPDEPTDPPGPDPG
jgi:anti-anti-sigma factor